MGKISRENTSKSDYFQKIRSCKGKKREKNYERIRKVNERLYGKRKNTKIKIIRIKKSCLRSRIGWRGSCQRLKLIMMEINFYMKFIYLF
jgi:hypothetical protein